MCGVHWAIVPLPEQREVFAALADRGGETAPLTDRYVAAAERAAAAVEARTRWGRFGTVELREGVCTALREGVVMGKGATWKEAFDAVDPRVGQG